MENVRTGKYIKLCRTVKEKMFDIALQEIEGMDEEEARYFLMDDAVPNYGAVTKLIYHSDTSPIAAEFYDEIIELICNIYGDNIPCSSVDSLNTIAWFAWEMIVLGNESNIDEIIELAKEYEVIPDEDDEDEDEEEIDCE